MAITMSLWIASSINIPRIMKSIVKYTKKIAGNVHLQKKYLFTIHTMSIIIL